MLLAKCIKMRTQTVLETEPRVVLKIEVLQMLENSIENFFTLFGGPAALSKRHFMVIVNLQINEGEIFGELSRGVKFY